MDTTKITHYTTSQISNFLEGKGMLDEYKNILYAQRKITLQEIACQLQTRALIFNSIFMFDSPDFERWNTVHVQLKNVKFVRNITKIITKSDVIVRPVLHPLNVIKYTDFIQLCSEKGLIQLLNNPFGAWEMLSNNKKAMITFLKQVGIDEFCKKSYCHDCLPFITHYIGE